MVRSLHTADRLSLASLPSMQAASDCQRYAPTRGQISKATPLEGELTLPIPQCIISGSATCILNKKVPTNSRNMTTQKWNANQELSTEEWSY